MVSHSAGTPTSVSHCRKATKDCFRTMHGIQCGKPTSLLPLARWCVCSRYSFKDYDDTFESWDRPANPHAIQEKQPSPGLISRAHARPVLRCNVQTMQKWLLPGQWSTEAFCSVSFHFDCCVFQNTTALPWWASAAPVLQPSRQSSLLQA